LDENAPPYRPLTATPEDQPDPARVGVVRMAPGVPFEHFSAVCGASGGFGFGSDFMQAKPGTWYCYEHREEGQQHWKAGTLPAPTVVG